MPLWEYNPQAMRNALERHHAILHRAIRENDGQVFQIVGDAFCAAFTFPSQAVAAAVAAQRGLAEAEWGETGLAAGSCGSRS